MKPRRRAATFSKKAPTGIPGLDNLTEGGLPRGRTTLLVGGPGSGKTILGMQFLVNGAVVCQEPGIFVAFEETSRLIAENVEGFGWPIAELQRKQLFFMDAQPMPDHFQVGEFDLSGMLASLGGQSKKMGARRIVFDALDIVLALLADPLARRREICRLHTWLLEQGLTGLITGKKGIEEDDSTGEMSFSYIQFMVDCSIVLNHRVSRGVSQRSLRVQKYRGSSFHEDEAPFVIGENGFHVAVADAAGGCQSMATTERVSSGVYRLDTMLGGGYFRGASVLITGFPGTAKTTLSGAFAEAACRRGDHTTFVSFDSDSGEVIRNLTSVGIRLKRFVTGGRLSLVSARTKNGSAESLFVWIAQHTKENRSRCLVIDPISTFAKSGNEMTASRVAERLIDWCKADGITLLCTSLLDDAASQSEAGTPLQISTLADTWIHLSYLVQSGERNRALSVIKSRGTAHSNQVRELLLRDSGITLADIYAARGEVLMGTLRWEKEGAEMLEHETAAVDLKLRAVRLGAEQAELQVRLKSIQTELFAKQVEKTLLLQTQNARARQLSRSALRVRKFRGADSVSPPAKKP